MGWMHQQCMCVGVFIAYTSCDSCCTHLNPIVSKATVVVRRCSTAFSLTSSFIWSWALLVSSSPSALVRLLFPPSCIHTQLHLHFVRFHTIQATIVAIIVYVSGHNEKCWHFHSRTNNKFIANGSAMTRWSKTFKWFWWTACVCVCWKATKCYCSTMHIYTCTCTLVCGWMND